MRFSADGPDKAAVAAQIEAEGPMVNCPNCGGPICRLFAAESDRFWKQHYANCEAFAARLAAEDAYYRDDFQS